VKIPLPGSSLGPNTFADFDAALEASGADLLVYVGGAVSPSEYFARRESSPTALLTLLRPDGARHSALALSYSPSLPGRPEDAREAFLDHFLYEVLPALPIRPDRLAVIGFSLGAALALLLARANVRQVVRLATVGAVGAAEALSLESAPLGPLSCPVRVAWGTEDPCLPHSLRFLEALEAAGLRYDADTSPGGHAYPDYVANGLLPAAVAFAAHGLSKSC
jgi:dienelactone hydrolase